MCTLSIDDFAFRRGHTYGTYGRSGSILVDLERHRAVDLLPDQSGSSFAAWLAAHLGVLQARQVADRYHLLRNLRDVVLRVLKLHVRLVERVVPPQTGVQPLTRFRLDREGARERTRAEMQTRCHTAKDKRKGR